MSQAQPEDPQQWQQPPFAEPTYQGPVLDPTAPGQPTFNQVFGQQAPAFNPHLVVTSASLPPATPAESAIRVIGGLIWPIAILLAVIGAVHWWPAILMAIIASAVLKRTSGELRRRRIASAQQLRADQQDLR